MTTTPRLQRRVKKTSGYKIPPDIEKVMNAMVESGEFANRADIHTAALRFWFQYRQFDVRTAVCEYLQSEEGQQLILELIKKSRSRT